LYTQESILKLLEEGNDISQSKDDKRHILVFHCEFSSERAPKL